MHKSWQRTPGARFAAYPASLAWRGCTLRWPESLQ